jgi:HNH endonuclease
LLRRVGDASVSFHPRRFKRTGRVRLWGAGIDARIGEVDRPTFEASELAQQLRPQRLLQRSDRTYWQFQGRVYWENDDLDEDAVYALLVTKKQRDDRRIDRAKQMSAMGTEPRGLMSRGQIPDDVKRFVWTRDGGCCRNCGSVVELQFDHVIPVAMGGSSEPENLQILCGPCNRRKGASLTVG